MKLEHVEVTVDIQATTQHVWDAITNWTAQDKWMLGTRVTPVHGDGKDIGGQIEAFTGIWKIGFLDTMEITRWDPPHRCDVIHTGRVVRGTGTFAVSALSAQTSRFVWSEDLDLPLGIIGKIGFWLMKPLFVAGVRQSLAKFANLVEQGQI